MEKNTEKTKVIFRVDKRKEWCGTVTALFPEIIGLVNAPYTMMAYEHIGQHCTAHVNYMQSTRLATEQEYADLKKELEEIGYNLVVVKKTTRADYLKRKTQCR